MMMNNNGRSGRGGRVNNQGQQMNQQQTQQGTQQPQQPQGQMHLGLNPQAGQASKIYQELNNFFNECVQRNVGQGKIIDEDNMTSINIFLFSQLAKNSNRRGSKYVVNPQNKDFHLRLSVTRDENTRSRRAHVDRSNIHESMTPDLEEDLKKVTSGTDNIDNIQNVLDLYIDTFLNIESGVDEFMMTLHKNQQMTQDVVRVINSGEIFVEYGGFRIYPTVDLNEGKYSFIYECTQVVKLSIKNDYSW